MPTAGLASAFFSGAQQLRPNLEKGERRGEIHLGLGLAAVTLVKDSVFAVALLEHRFKVLALLDRINQTRRPWLVRR